MIHWARELVTCQFLRKVIVIRTNGTQTEPRSKTCRARPPPQTFCYLSKASLRFSAESSPVCVPSRPSIEPRPGKAHRRRRACDGEGAPWGAGGAQVPCGCWVDRLLMGLLRETGEDEWPLGSWLPKKVADKDYSSSALVCKNIIEIFPPLQSRSPHKISPSDMEPEAVVVRCFLPQAELCWEPRVGHWQLTSP